jgi:CheY-like chemotaxis protein
MKYILVVEDDKIVNLLITRELQKQGYGVLMSYDAVQAGTSMTRSRVDAVIVDVMMPGGNAFDVIKRMKISTRLGPIPIIAISSSMTPELAEDLRALGADRCMKKPIDLEFLNKVLSELLADDGLQILHRSTAQTARAVDPARREMLSGVS